MPSYAGCGGHRWVYVGDKLNAFSFRLLVSIGSVRSLWKRHRTAYQILMKGLDENGSNYESEKNNTYIS